MNNQTETMQKNGLTVLFQYRDFIIVWAGNTVSRFGDALDSIAFVWMVYKMTGSLALMGTVMAVNALPSMLFGMAAGVLVDRMNKKTIMVMADLLRGCSTLLTALLFLTNSLQVWYLFVFTFFNSFCEIFASPARATAMQAMVRKEHLLSANSLREAANSTAQIFGTGIAAFILGFMGIGAAVVIDAGTFFISAVSAMIARLEHTAVNFDKFSLKGFYSEMLEGIGVVKSNTVLLLCVFIACIANLLLTPFNVILPVYSDKILHVGAKGFSYIEMGFTIGIVVGSIAVGYIGSRLKKSRLAVAGFIALGLAIGSFSVISSLLVAVAVSIAAGVFMAPITTVAVTIVQEITPKDKLGRVFSILSTICLLSLPVGYAVSGFVAAGLNVQRTFLVLGIGIFIVSLLPLFNKGFMDI